MNKSRSLTQPHQRALASWQRETNSKALQNTAGENQRPKLSRGCELPIGEGVIAYLRSLTRKEINSFHERRRNSINEAVSILPISLIIDLLDFDEKKIQHNPDSEFTVVTFSISEGDADTLTESGNAIKRAAGVAPKNRPTVCALDLSIRTEQLPPDTLEALASLALPESVEFGPVSYI
jgi:hypothetical protein